MTTQCGGEIQLYINGWGDYLPNRTLKRKSALDAMCYKQSIDAGWYILVEIGTVCCSSTGWTLIQLGTDVYNGTVQLDKWIQIDTGCTFWRVYLHFGTFQTSL